MDASDANNEIPLVNAAWVPQPSSVPWPTSTWSHGETSSLVHEVVDEAFRLPELSTTNAVVVVHRGRIVAERYFGAKEHFDQPPEPITAETKLISWSMAKSMIHALVGMLVDDGRLSADQLAPVPEWSDLRDPRHAIRLADLLAMRDGLDYVEDYVDGAVSNVIEMLFGSGRADVAGYTAARPLKHEPDSLFNYSSGTTNVISRIVAQEVGFGDSYKSFIESRLFHPIGMMSAEPTMDDAGVFIGSSFVHATAQDFARFGYLYLRGGQWDGQQILSTNWTGTAQVPHSVEVESGNFYSWQWWVTADHYGTYWASGYDGQQISIVPALDAVIVRLGRTPADRNVELRAWRRRLLDALSAS